MVDSVEDETTKRPSHQNLLPHPLEKGPHGYDASRWLCGVSVLRGEFRAAGLEDFAHRRHRRHLTSHVCCDHHRVLSMDDFWRDEKRMAHNHDKCRLLLPCSVHFGAQAVSFHSSQPDRESIAKSQARQQMIRIFERITDDV